MQPFDSHVRSACPGVRVQTVAGLLHRLGALRSDFLPGHVFTNLCGFRGQVDRQQTFFLHRHIQLTVLVSLVSRISGGRNS